MIHLATKVTILGDGEILSTCSCGVSRETSELMHEHQDSAKWREFTEAVLNGREVTILGRKMSLA